MLEHVGKEERRASVNVEKIQNSLARELDMADPEPVKNIKRRVKHAKTSKLE